ncbi:nicotinate-nucleotide adenylyltransferase [Melghirimyces algeriensis]|uniref:Probable nicotinate-nucleotide adenylyltransferase n=1 Tax=Melghirimyces algeriensis TaxID=910412 RepID=A0A521BUT9_9BACL|nr:nicotinate-nucleotide adenylyltransferase [Melghirimyces algeriensis]SMO50942.1 nicotinate-nucleotide adenylyltransferase [Melghirimyces algeriensis]
MKDEHKKKNVGIYGGTFDPVHIGHLMMAEQARQKANLDEVWFVPAACPPHKKGAVASAEDRMTMVEKAVLDHPFFRASAIELKREGPSYTVDTVRKLAQDHPDVQFHLIVGTDMVRDLPRWYKIKEIADIVNFIGLVRPGFILDIDQIPEHIKNRLTLIHNGIQMNLSSTWVREQRAKGNSVRYIVPESVRQYMKEHRLYEP